MNEIPSFPDKTVACISTPAFLSDRGFFIRHANDNDITSLRALYADTRAEEMARVPWLPIAKQQFLDQQFNLQHQHYLKNYADADFMVIEHKGIVQARYYLQRTAPAHLIVDICFLAQYRGQGMGRALIEASQREAQALQCGMELHVLKFNVRAHQLYEKLGFIACDNTDSHSHMRWQQNEVISASSTSGARAAI